MFCLGQFDEFISAQQLVANWLYYDSKFAGGSYAPFLGGCQHAGGMLACSRKLSGGVAKPRLKPVLKMKRVELHEIQKISIYGECKDLFVKQ